MRRKRASGTAITMREWIHSQTRNRDAAPMLRLMVAGPLHGRSRPGLAALLPLLHPVGRQPRGAVGDRGRGPGVPRSRQHAPARRAHRARSCSISWCWRLRPSAIAQDASGVTVTSPAGAFRAARAIVTIPLPLTARIVYEPGRCPPRRDALAQRSPMGSVIKYWVAYREPFWRKRGWNGEVTSDRPPTDGFYDASPPDASVGLARRFHRGEHARSRSAAGRWRSAAG